MYSFGHQLNPFNSRPFYCYESQLMVKLSIDQSKLCLIDKFINIYRYFLYWLWHGIMRIVEYLAMTYRCQLVFHLVSGRELFHWQLYFIFLYLYSRICCCFCQISLKEFSNLLVRCVTCLCLWYKNNEMWYDCKWNNYQLNLKWSGCKQW